jgi:septal ring factor EnvC (AmiA/AmiB activator)
MHAAARDRDAAAARFQSRSGELARERGAKRTILRELRRNRTRERQALYERAVAAQVLAETLARRGAGGASRDRFTSAGRPFASLRGRLDPPVAGEVLAGFGRVVDPEFRTETFRKGVDIAAAEGTPVRAVADGSVRFAGWFRGYGKIVILDHGEGYFTVSGHLADTAVALGERVAAGDPLGSVGETGSLSGPRLYFEIREGEPSTRLRFRTMLNEPTYGPSGLTTGVS